VVALGLGAFVAFSGGSDNQAAALAPDFELETNSGDTVRLSDYRGQPVAVTFMHSY
jgi:cytochrome oxidase Cu insertion factor (SCO1/SenC/PrrC family)